jgi:ankyrin repeat protein
LKRTATLTSETVVRPLAQTPDQPIIHNQSTTPIAQHEIKVQIPTAVIVEQTAIAELHSVSSFSSHEPTPIPAIVEPNELESVHIARPSLQHASASSLTVSNQERSSPDRSRSRSPKRHPPVNVVPGKTLFVAARAGKKDILLRILRGGAKITEVEPDGTTVLQAAAEKNQLDVVLSLLFFGADPNLGGGQMSSPILAATYRQHVQVVAALLEAGADPSVVHPEALPWMKSAVHSALYRQNSEILSMLLRARAADPNGIPGLLQYACHAGTLNSVKQLLDAGLDINDFSNSTTALQAAVGRNHTAIVRFLLEQNADPNITFLDSLPWERSPLSAAIYKQNAEILSILLGAGADPNKVPGLLPYVTETNDFQCVKMMIEGNANIDSIDDNLGTALQVAAAKGKRDVLIYLLDCGADPNIEGGRYGSALNAAITNGHEDCVIELLGGGIDD